MKQYNIYAGYGEALYQFTETYNSEAEIDACKIAYSIYEKCSDKHDDYLEILNNYCEDKETPSKEDFEIINDLYHNYIDALVDYYVIETTKDNIDKKDLILGYRKNGNSSETNSK